MNIVAGSFIEQRRSSAHTCGPFVDIGGSFVVAYGSLCGYMELFF